MEFRQFRYILKTAEEGSISLAAQKLYISQPSLSQLIASVEKKIGASLFDRSNTPLRPTLVGQLYLDAARRILNIDHEFRQQVDDVLNLKTGHIIVGSSPFRSTYLLAPFLPVFQQKYPLIELTLVENTTRNLEQLVLRGEVDFVISLLPIDRKEFDHVEIFSEELLLALPPKHPLAEEKGLEPGNFGQLPEISLTELKDTPFILIHKEQKMHDALMSLCKKAGFTPRIQTETRSMEAAQAMAGAGFCATLLPHTLIHGNHPPLPPCYAALDTHPTRQVIVAWRQNRYLSRASRQFIEDLRDFCANSYPAR